MTTRIFQGFVISIEDGDTYRVGFVVDDKVVRYDFPAKPLREANIIAEGQPFELIEDGDQYTFKPLARPEEAVMERLPLDAEHQAKLDFILKHFNRPVA